MFSTRNQRTTTDEYFLRSSCDVSFFLEEGALNAAGEITTASKAQALNKIGRVSAAAATTRASCRHGATASRPRLQARAALP